MHTRTRIVIAAAAAAMSAMPTLAQVQSFAQGSDLAGGTLTIEWSTGGGVIIGVTAAPIVAGGVAGTAIVPAPLGGGTAFFTVSGDTFTNDWILENNSQFWIASATFDLSTSLSLFDDDSLPSTPNSALGLNDVAYQAISTAPMEIFADELTPWPSIANLGDMYLRERIEWDIVNTFNAFLPMQHYVWRDDTDVVPAPGSLALLGLAGVAVGRRRRD